MNDPLAPFIQQLFTFVVPIGLVAVLVGTVFGLIAKRGEDSLSKRIQGQSRKNRQFRK